MPVKALDAYKDVERNTLEGRALEAMVFGKAAIALQEVLNTWDAPQITQRLDDALRFNQKLWTLFQVEWTHEDCPLPADLRLNLLSLSAFVDKRTFETMASPSPEKLEVLISINLNLAAGLRGDAAQAAE